MGGGGCGGSGCAADCQLSGTPAEGKVPVNGESTVLAFGREGGDGECRASGKAGQTVIHR